MFHVAWILNKDSECHVIFILCLDGTKNWERPCEERWFLLVSQELLLPISLCSSQSEHTRQFCWKPWLPLCCHKHPWVPGGACI